MKWIRYTIETTTEAEDFLSAFLADAGVDGIEIEDNVPLAKEDQAAMFIDFLPEIAPDDGRSRISFYVEEGTDEEAMLLRVREVIEETRGFCNVGSGEITRSETEDLDWMNNWKQYFSSFTIDDILIKPTWEELKEEDRDKFLIEIDPGSSFGTGKHETTQLCIRALRKYIQKDDKVLDLGFGSGILSICALKLGASDVGGTDIDENCKNSALENLATNHLSEDAVCLHIGNVIEDADLRAQIGTGYDVVVANILADVIIPMAPFLPDFLAKDGILITSGIIDFKEEEVKEALVGAGMSIVESTAMGEWRSVIARRKG